MNDKRLKKAINEAWRKETCFPPMADKWRPDNPAYGQCLVTALVVQDYYGGDLLYCCHNPHYWNRLPNGRELDLTSHQFKEGTVICQDETRTRKYALENKTAKRARALFRYRVFKKRVEENLRK